jgi:predicted MFS family arabinose efflux permease
MGQSPKLKNTRTIRQPETGAAASFAARHNPFSRIRSIYRQDAHIKAFLLALLLYGIGFGLYKGVQDNYLAGVVHIDEFERGIVEFFRELPGLLVIVFLAILYRFSENQVFKIGMAIMFAGLAGLLACGSGKALVILFITIYSLGEHLVLPLRSSMSLERAKPGKGGASLGIISGINQAGHILGFLIVMILFSLFDRFDFPPGKTGGFKIVFALGTGLSAAALLAAAAMRESSRPIKRQSFYFARKFTTYYMLEIFYGARKQVFITFAPYVLILQYGAATSTISLLLAVTAAFGVIFAPLIGKFIDHVGYKFVMVTDTIILVGVCFFYGFSHRIFPAHIAYIVVCVNYILDSIISLASMASSMYVKDIADNQQEITMTVSTGVSVNHIMSILIALLGGWIWDAVGIETLFTMSAVLGLINSMYAATIKPRKHEHSGT